jgi:hypothetical protein
MLAGLARHRFKSDHVIPATAGIHLAYRIAKAVWIPACAGMTSFEFLIQKLWGWFLANQFVRHQTGNSTLEFADIHVASLAKHSWMFDFDNRRRAIGKFGAHFRARWARRRRYWFHVLDSCHERFAWLQWPIE